MKDRTAYIVSFVLHGALLLFFSISTHKSFTISIPLQMPGEKIIVEIEGLPPAQSTGQIAQNKEDAAQKKESSKPEEPKPEEPKKDLPKPEPPKEEKPKPDESKVEAPKEKHKPDPKLSDDTIQDLLNKLATPTATPKPKKQSTPKPTTTPKPGNSPKNASGAKQPTPTPVKSNGAGTSSENSAPASIAGATSLFPRIPLSGIGQGFSKGTEKGAPGQIGGTSNEFFVMGDPNAPYDFLNYGAILGIQLKRAWRPPTVVRPQYQEYTTIVSFTIAKDGTISDIQLVQQSGWPANDESVLKALQELKTVEPLPITYAASSVQVNAPFINPISMDQ